MRVLTLALVLLAINAMSQNKKENLLSRVYFPFNLGYFLTSNSNINPGGLVKTGLEYRVNKSYGLHFRYAYDIRSTRYKISQNTTTNALEGKVKFNDNIIGLGYRLGKQKLKTIGLLQTGLSSYQNPTITGTTNDYKIIDKKAQEVIYKFTLGVEYYIDQTTAIIIETDYSILSRSIFLGDALGVSLGITTTLF